MKWKTKSPELNARLKRLHEKYDVDTRLAKLTSRILARRLRIKETCTPEEWAYYYSEMDIPGKHLLQWLFEELPRNQKPAI